MGNGLLVVGCWLLLDAQQLIIPFSNAHGQF